MARVTGPLMSIDASGSLAGAIVFSKWRGRNYVRRHAVPANPRTAAQVSMRAIIGFLAQQWAGILAQYKATWLSTAEANKISEFNQFVKINARRWRDVQMPFQSFPLTGNDGAGTVGTLAKTVLGRQVQIKLTESPAADDWGLVLCRSLSTGFTVSTANAVIVTPKTGGAHTIVDGPLAPGTYYYNAFLFSTYGEKGTDGTQVQAIVV